MPAASVKLNFPGSAKQYPASHNYYHTYLMAQFIMMLITCAVGPSGSQHDLQYNYNAYLRRPPNTNQLLLDTVLWADHSVINQLNADD